MDHLRGRGVTDDELLETGLATRARTGNLIDRFRDRAVLPITHEDQILGFVARRHPDLTDDDHAGPKYLNTADTVLFHKGAQLYGAIPALLEAGAVPVLVEGPIDALAVTLAGRRPVRRRRPAGNRPHRRAGPSARHAEHATRSSPPTPTCPVASPPNAPSGSSPNTAQTRSPSTCPTGPTPPPSSTPTAQTHSSTLSTTLAPSDRS